MNASSTAPQTAGEGQRVRRLASLARCAGLLAVSGCASAVLNPAPEARMVPGTASAAMAEVAGVRVTVQADAWDGARSVTDRVQPLRVTIENRSTSTVRVRYGDFALVAANGRRLPALPPVRVEGELLSPMLAPGFAPIIAPRFSYRRFYVAPYLAPLYPGVPVYGRPYVFYDPGYYAFWHVDFTRAVRSSVEVLSLALPEGVIEPEGQVAGFLYFRTVDPDAGQVVFRAAIVAVHGERDAVGGTVLGEVAVPFTVTKRR